MMKPIRRLSLVEGICKRPSMYSANGSPEEIFLILEGIFLATRDYNYGCSKADNETKIDIEVLVEKYNGPTDCHSSCRGFFDANIILDGIKAEGYRTNEEIFGRVMGLIEKNRPTQ